MNITIKLLEKWGSCYSYDQHKKIFDDAGKTEFTPLEIANLNSVPVKDRIWVLLHKEIINERELRLLACDFAEHAMKNVVNIDPRSINAIVVSLRFANGEATHQEMAAASAAARVAASAAARDVACDVACAAASAAARVAAWAAASAAAWAPASAAASNAQLTRIVNTLETIYKC